MKNEDAALQATRTQAAIVRTLANEIRREAAGEEEATGLRDQAVEESARLVTAATALSKVRSENPGAPDVGRTFDVSARARVLVVEDDGVTRDAIAAGLASNYDVFCAADGTEGVRAASEHAFDAIVTDLWMPEMDGITMVAQIQGMNPNASIPVVLLTGETGPEPIVQGFSAGVTTYLVKPVDLGLLEQELRWALASSREPRGDGRDPTS
jgi:CheY-like chemotaxis protein